MVFLTPIERETLQVFFIYISQMLNVSTFGNTADIYATVHLVPHPCQHITGERGVEAQRQCPSQTPIRKSSTGLNPGTGVATALTRHLLVLCVLY